MLTAELDRVKLQREEAAAKAAEEQQAAAKLQQQVLADLARKGQALTAAHLAAAAAQDAAQQSSKVSAHHACRVRPTPACCLAIMSVSSHQCLLAAQNSSHALPFNQAAAQKASQMYAWWFQVLAR